MENTMLTDSEKSLIDTIALYVFYNELRRTGRISEETYQAYHQGLVDRQLDICTYYEERRLEIHANAAEFLLKKAFGKD
jgi:hypothetical protein